jgi:hypothetical protein
MTSGWAGKAYLLRLARAVWVGLSYGLAAARLLYEAEPVRLAPLGGLWPSLALGGLGILIAAGAEWLASRKAADRAGIPCGAGVIPAVLVWLYILAPPAGRFDRPVLAGLILLVGAVALSLMVRLWRLLPPWAASLLVGGAALTAYLLTLQPTVGRADTFEFQVTAPVLGIAHPTGYPLYLVLGKLFSLLPVGSVAVRVNLLSAVAAAVAVALQYEIMRHSLRADPVAAALAALAFGLSPVFWSQAVMAEVYALHNAFVAAILGAALRTLPPAAPSEVPDAPPDHAAPRPFPLVTALFALIGLSLSNHLTTVLLVPAVGIALLMAWPRLTWRQWALTAGALLAGLLIYLYIPLRWPALHEGRLMPLEDFAGWITGSRFSGALQLRAWLSDPERWRIMGRLIVSQYGWPGVALGVLGLAVMFRQSWQAALVTSAACAAYVFYGLNYLVPDISVFVIPVFLIQALWMGYAVNGIIRWLAKIVPARLHEQTRSVVLVAFSLLPLSTAWMTAPTFNWRDEQALEAWGRYVLSLPLASDSVILADSEKIAPLEYLHRIEGLRPDVTMIVAGTEQEYFDILYARLGAGQTVYLARFLPGLEGLFSLRSLGPLIEVGTEPLREPPPRQGEPHTWADGIVLLGCQLGDEPAQAGAEAHLTLLWQSPPAAVERNYQVRLRLLDQTGQTAWQAVPAYPVGNRYPTAAWKPDEIIPDYHALTLPYTLQAGQYRLQVALTPPFSDEAAPLAEGGQWADVATLRVAPVAGRLPIAGRPLTVTFPGGALTGIDAPERAPNGRVNIVTSWQVGGQSLWTESTLAGGEGRSLPFGDLVLRAEEADSAGGLQWVLAGPSLRCGWLHPPAASCLLGRTRLVGRAGTQAIANFDNQILLTGVEFQAGRIQPGQVIPVTLHWQALRRMQEDYTVFVHLLGPDGRLHGQVDAWPVQGTYPTSSWQAGESITDPYLVRLEDDAPPGNYQLEIGLYLLGTNARLSVLGPDGLPVDDRVLLEGLVVPAP